MTIEGFDKTSAINTKGAFFSLQALLSSLAISTSVVFISSILVYIGFSGVLFMQQTKRLLRQQYEY